MYKIVILGCENSHANNFLRLIAEGHYPEIEVIGIYTIAGKFGASLFLCKRLTGMK